MVLDFECINEEKVVQSDYDSDFEQSIDSLVNEC